tara:strand:+ start:256 stop:1209 length:954 start_codon:yes stop_codon:yes gene_type:complete
MNDRRTLYPITEPFNTGFLKVDDIHTLYFEECGNPNGKPAVFLHGGPGGGITPAYRGFFNPEKYRVVLFDQRGCGQSTPHAELTNNTTPHLIADIEQLRTHLKIDTWQVFGGSWGSTLALAYAQTHPERVTELVLRGIYLCREVEQRWIYQEGLSKIFPDAFEPYATLIAPEKRYNFIAAYHELLTGDDENLKLAAAREWTLWETRCSKLLPDEQAVKEASNPHFALAFARIENHFFYHNCWLEDGQLLNNAHRLHEIPGTIVQGRYDMVCPPTSAWELHKAWPGSDLEIVADAGHSAMEPGLVDALVRATDKYANR